MLIKFINELFPLLESISPNLSFWPSLHPSPAAHLLLSVHQQSKLQGDAHIFLGFYSFVRLAPVQTSLISVVSIKLRDVGNSLDNCHCSDPSLWRWLRHPGWLSGLSPLEERCLWLSLSLSTLLKYRNTTVRVMIKGKNQTVTVLQRHWEYYEKEVFKWKILSFGNKTVGIWT